MRDTLAFFLQSSLTLIVLGVMLLAAIIAAAILAFRLRETRKRRDDETHADRLEAERETQLTSAARQMLHARESSRIATQIADLLAELCWSRVLAVYAGRPDLVEAKNVLPESASVGLDQAVVIPKSVPLSLLSQFSWPRVAALSALVGSPAVAGRDSVTAAVTAEADSESRPETSPAESFKTGPLAQQADASNDRVLMLPWSGPFHWSGVIVCKPGPGAEVESLTSFREPLMVMGERLAIALELEKAEAEAGSTERAVQFSRALLVSLEEPSPVASLIKEVAPLLGSDSAALWRVDLASGMVSMVASHGLKSAEFLPLPVGQGLAGNIIQSAKVLTLEDAPADPRCIFPREARESGIAAYMGAPVEVDGKVVGVLEAHSSHPHPWSDAELRLLEAAATVVGQLMKSADARGNRLRVESAYLGLSEALQRLRTPDDLMDAAVEVLGHALGVSRALVVELDETGSPEPIRHEYRTADVQTATGATLGGSLASEVVTAGSGKAIAISDSTEGSLLTPTAAAELRVQSEMAVAVRLDGTVRSIIYLHQCDRLREWRDDETEFVERVARQLSLSLTSVRSFEAAAGEVKSAKEDARQAGEGVARVQALINALPESVLVLDGESRLNYFNATARERFGLTNEDIGRNASVAEAFHLSDGPVWQQVTSAQHPARLEARLTRAIVDATGEQGIATASQTAMPVSISVAPFRSAQGGAIVGRIVVLTDVGHLSGSSVDLTSGLAELQQKVLAAETALTHARSLLSAAEAGEARATLEADAARQSQAEATTAAEELRDEVARAQSASQQLLETNRLKSDFIVSAGHEIEASLQPVLGITELLGQGQYGPLTPEQQEAIRNIYAWAKRIKSDVDWLIEYGSARSRRLEPSSE